MMPPPPRSAVAAPAVTLGRRTALLLFAALLPAVASALEQTYEGTLVPDNRNAPIPVVVELKDLSINLTGNVKTSAPLKGGGRIETGTHVAGSCRLIAMLTKTVALRLFGSCEAKSYTGTYSIVGIDRKVVSAGTFHLTAKTALGGKTDAKSDMTPTTTATACMRTNTQCLAACPRDDNDAAFMCTNHCRTKLKACRGAVKKPAPEPE